MRAPAEWEPHELTLMGWPCRAGLWGDTFAQACADYASVANAVAQFEPVMMIANPGADAAAARGACAGAVEIVELPIDDSWLRDSGPIYVLDDDGRRAAVHFRFNAWGEKFPPWDRDAAIGGLIARRLGDPVIDGGMVLEGGSILTDGDGTLVTTEQCLLCPNRNPAMSRAQIEATLRDRLGVERIVWLGLGLTEDRDTDGHVDMICSLTGPGRALIQTVPESNPNFERCETNRARLQGAGFEVTPVPVLSYARVAGETVAVGHLNLYICNGGVIVPVTGAAQDAEAEAQALEIIAAAFTGREVVAVPGTVIAYGGGGPHCITQQVPVNHV